MPADISSHYNPGLHCLHMVRPVLCLWTYYINTLLTDNKGIELFLLSLPNREDFILSVYKEGKRTPDEIVPIVYKDVNSEMWPFAKRNIELHLRKLMEEGKIPSKI